MAPTTGTKTYINNTADLDSLQEGAVIRTAEGIVAEKYGWSTGDAFCPTGSADPLAETELTFPAMLLYNEGTDDCA